MSECCNPSKRRKFASIPPRVSLIQVSSLFKLVYSPPSILQISVTRTANQSDAWNRAQQELAGLPPPIHGQRHRLTSSSRACPGLAAASSVPTQGGPLAPFPPALLAICQDRSPSPPGRLGVRVSAEAGDWSCNGQGCAVRSLAPSPCRRACAREECHNRACATRRGSLGEATEAV
jgi:hypothetical protein